MKRIRVQPKTMIFQLAPRERQLFVDVLSRYPVVPAAYQPLSRSLRGKFTGEDQSLLNEALAEQRGALRQQLQQWLQAPSRFRRVKLGFNFTLRQADADWLLQVLNDVRVGHWLLLGSPEEMLDVDDLENLDPELHRAWVIMELSGMFQMEILQALAASPTN